MKVNYKEKDEVTIIKLGTFHGLTGKIITNHPGTEFKPLSIDLGIYGTWQFAYEDVQLTKAEKKTYETYAFDEPKKVKKPAKKQVKTKRAYTKRNSK